MPGYVIHLSIANKYLEKNNTENRNEFFKGVIAPDLTDNKLITHYGNGSSETNLQLYLSENKIETSYNKGFFLHLITDYLFYNRFLKKFTKDIYNDYDILNAYLIQKYNVILPDIVKKYVFFKEGKLTILDKESVIDFIDSFANLNLLEVEKEVKSDIPKGKWNTFNFSKINSSCE